MRTTQNIAYMAQCAIHKLNDGNDIEEFCLKAERILDSCKGKDLFKAGMYFGLEHWKMKLIGSDISRLINLNLLLILLKRNLDIEGCFDDESSCIDAEVAKMLLRDIKNNIGIDIGEDIEKRVLKKNGSLKKKGIEEIQKSTEISVMKNRYYKYVLSKMLHDDQKRRNVGIGKKAKARAESVEQFGKYASKRLVSISKKQTEDSIEAMKAMEISGTGLSVYDVRKTEKHAFNELYVEMVGIQELADEKNMTWLFITLTLPPQYHSNPKIGKYSYSGKSVQDGKDYFQNKWSTLGKRFQKDAWKDLRFSTETGFGKRVKEPHAHGAIHEHIMLFCTKELKERYVELFRSIYGKSSTSCKIVEKNVDVNSDELDKKESSAASYIMKYISKSMNVEFRVSDDCNRVEPLSNNNNAIIAWRRASNIRMISSFGYNGVRDKYNNCRKLINKLKAEEDKLVDTIAYIKDFIANNLYLSKKYEQVVFDLEKQIETLRSLPIDEKLTFYRSKTGSKSEDTELLKLGAKMQFAEKSIKTGNVNYKKFMDISDDIEYVFDMEVDKRGREKKVKKGIRMLGSEFEVKL